MPERRCEFCGAGMEHVSESGGRPIMVTPPDSDRQVPAVLWVCGRCGTALFLVNDDK